MEGEVYRIFNGELISSAIDFTGNRAFKYGDGLFETIRITNGEVQNLPAHISRLQEGAKTLKFNWNQNWDLPFFEGLARKLILANSIEAGGRMRLTMYRSGEGAYIPQSNDCSFIIEAVNLSTNFYELNKEGKIMDVFPDMVKEVNILSKYKTLNSLLFVMAGIYATEKKLHDCFITDRNGKIVESISSNVFLVSNGVLYTPPLEDGCVGGVMRMNVINTALENKITVYESTLTPQNLLIADEVFLSNSINGIEWVGAFRNKRYFNKIAKTILRNINAKQASLKLDLPGN